MPPFGLLLGRIDFSSLFYVLDTSKGIPLSLAEAKAKGIPVIAYGQFINDIIAFLIVAFAVFMLVKQVNRIKSSLDRAGCRCADDEGVPVLRVDDLDQGDALSELHVTAGVSGGVGYISTWTPSSTTRSGGRRKNAVARTALRAIRTNSFSRQIAMPGGRA